MCLDQKKSIIFSEINRRPKVETGKKILSAAQMCQEIWGNVARDVFENGKSMKDAPQKHTKKYLSRHHNTLSGKTETN